MTVILVFLFGVAFGGILGWGMATLRYGQARTADPAALAAALDRVKRA